MSWLLWGQIASLMIIGYVLACSGYAYSLKTKAKAERGELK